MTIASTSSCRVTAPSSGTATRLGMLDTGDCFGEASYVEGAKRTATIRAALPSQVLKVSSNLVGAGSASCQFALQPRVPAHSHRPPAERDSGPNKEVCASSSGRLALFRWRAYGEWLWIDSKFLGYSDDVSCDARVVQQPSGDIAHHVLDDNDDHRHGSVTYFSSGRFPRFRRSCEEASRSANIDEFLQPNVAFQPLQ